jgi:hypothetical protein
MSDAPQEMFGTFADARWTPKRTDLVREDNKTAL